MIEDYNMCYKLIFPNVPYMRARVLIALIRISAFIVS